MVRRANLLAVVGYLILSGAVSFALFASWRTAQEVDRQQIELCGSVQYLRNTLADLVHISSAVQTPAGRAEFLRRERELRALKCFQPRRIP